LRQQAAKAAQPIRELRPIAGDAYQERQVVDASEAPRAERCAKPLQQRMDELRWNRAELFASKRSQRLK
jgi:hypothetical protein